MARYFSTLSFTHGSVFMIIAIPHIGVDQQVHDTGCLRESTHLTNYTGKRQHKGTVVMLSPTQWCSSVQLLAFSLYSDLAS